MVVTIDGQHYETTVKSDLTWSVAVDSGHVTDSSEVNATVTTTHYGTHNQHAAANEAYKVVSITIDSIATDGEVTGQDSLHEQTIVGHVNGDAKEGDAVTVTVGGQAYDTTVDKNLNWNVSVPGHVLMDADKDAVHATVSVTSPVTGQAVVAADTDKAYTVSVHPTIDINPITGDDVVTEHEGDAKQISVSGTVAGDAQADDNVVVTIDGQHYETTVKSDLTWSVAVDSGHVTDSSEVNATVTTTHYGTHNQHAAANEAYKVVSITIDSIATDGEVTGQDSLHEQTIVGHVNGDAKEG
ncbi:hypothetical protein C0W54_22145, partial [Photobacterium kishitanii]